MFYFLGLTLTAIVYGWITCDLALARGGRGSFPRMAMASAAMLAWVVGELLRQRAWAPDEVVAAHALLFLGVCSVGPLWLYASARAARAPWFERWPRLIWLAAVPGLFAWSTLFWDSSGLFIDWSRPHAVGPLFIVHAAWSWSLILLGFVAFARFLTPSAGRAVGWGAPAIGFALPFLAEVAYLVAGTDWDPTPLALGLSGLWIRLVLLDGQLSPHYLTFGSREVLAQLGAGIVVADGFDEVVDANEPAEAMLGDSRLVGASLGDVVARARAHPFRVIETTERPITRRGIRFGTVALLEDRTEAQAAARRLEVASRFEALGYLVAGVAHEINNPLAYVRSNLGLLQSLAEEVQASKWHRELSPRSRSVARSGTSIAGDAIEGAERIAALVRRLRTFVREAPDAGPRPETDLPMCVRRAMEMAGLGGAEDLLQITYEVAVDPVAAREEDVFQILLQLLINAIQASEKQSVVEIEVRWADEAAELRVLDRGPGIRPNLLPHVFDPFFTTKTGESNVGLGLSLAYDLARQNGGSLEVENREGGGACFTLRLPIALHEPDEDPQDPESQGGQVGSGASRRPGREG